MINDLQHIYCIKPFVMRSLLLLIESSSSSSSSLSLSSSKPLSSPSFQFDQIKGPSDGSFRRKTSRKDFVQKLQHHHHPLTLTIHHHHHRPRPCPHHRHHQSHHYPLKFVSASSPTVTLCCHRTNEKKMQVVFLLPQ